MDKPRASKTSKTIRKKRKSGGQNLLRLFFIGLAGYLILNFSHGFYQVYQLNKELVVLDEEKAALEEVNDQLLSEAAYLQSPEAIEKIAREKLGLIKEGEILILRAKEMTN